MPTKGGGFKEYRNCEKSRYGWQKRSGAYKIERGSGGSCAGGLVMSGKSRNN